MSGAADGDARLFGEGFQQFDLTVGEATGITAADRNNADRTTLAQQWDRQVRTMTQIQYHPK